MGTSASAYSYPTSEDLKTDCYTPPAWPEEHTDDEGKIKAYKVSPVTSNFNSDS